MAVTPEKHAVRVQAMKKEADDVVSVVLSRDDGGELPEYSCGAHLDLVLRPDLIRQYSLCGDPLDRSQWTIAVLRESEGRGGSAYIHDTLRPGMVVSVTGPRNNFPLVEAGQYLFIAGGIGITPLLGMVREVEARGRDWSMLYGGRRRASMAFVDELREYGPRVAVVPQDECGLLNLRSALDAQSVDARVYCCGPEALISAVEATCTDMGLLAPRIERFSARPDAVGDGEAAVNGPFEVVLAGSGQRFTIPPGKPITEVLEESGVYVPTSCTEGFCGTCQTEVVSGIPDHRDEYLSDEDRAANDTMMVCVSRSKTLVLELNL